jgi:hypothetical protein
VISAVKLIEIHGVKDIGRVQIQAADSWPMGYAQIGAGFLGARVARGAEGWNPAVNGQD